jgi:hypothetical protein
MAFSCCEFAVQSDNNSQQQLSDLNKREQCRRIPVARHAEAKAAAEAAATILKDNSNACTMSVASKAAINGLYSATQETGQGGMGACYRKSGESGPEALCIEHYKWQWQVKNEMDRGSGVCCAVPLLQETAHSTIVRRMNGPLSATESACINPTLR